MNESERHLGHPILFKSNKNLCFDTLILKIRKKTRSWQVNVLSQAGRNTLLKFVVSSLPVYDMLALQLPNKTILSMDKMMRNFWWGNGVDKRKFHTIKWSDLCKPIEEGGLGIRKSKKNNLVLLAKDYLEMHY